MGIEVVEWLVVGGGLCFVVGVGIWCGWVGLRVFVLGIVGWVVVLVLGGRLVWCWCG